MNVQICIKGVSNKENKIRRIIYEYEDRTYTVREFLAATVELTLERYNTSPGGGRTVQDPDRCGDRGPGADRQDRLRQTLQ